MASESGGGDVSFRGGSAEPNFSSLEEAPLLRGSKTRGGKYDSLDEALDGIGVGVFHILLILACGWAIASDSVEIQCISFVTPQLDSSNIHSNQSYTPRLNKSKEGVLDAIIFLGMMVGGYVWGALSDLIGRRSCLVTSLTVNGVFSLASAFSPNYPFFLVARFLSGVGVGGSFPVVFSYFSEFFARRSRGPFVIVLAAFWTLGSLYAALMAWVVIGNYSDVIHGQLGAMAIPAWRVYIILCTVPSLSSAFCFIFLPESPAFLFAKNKLKKTAKVLRKLQLFHSCCGRSKEVSEVRVWMSRLGAMRRESVSEGGEKKGVLAKAGELFRSTHDLFGPAYLRATIVLFIVWFMFSFGYYGLLLWFPEYFKYIEQCNYQREHNCTIRDTPHHAHHACSQSTTPCSMSAAQGADSAIYLDSLYVALAGVPGILLGILTVNIVGPKVMLIFSLMVSGVSTLLIWVIPDQQKSERVVVLLSSLFGGVAIIGWDALDVVTTSELFPVQLRSTAFGLQAVLGRIGAIVGNVSFGKLFDAGASPYLPILVVASALIFAGFSTLFLPTPRGDKTGCHRLRTLCMFCCRHFRFIQQEY